MFLDSISNSINSKRLKFDKGDKIFVQSSKVNSLFFVLSGRVKLVRENIEGKLLVIHTAYAGESFAEASLFTDNYHCHSIADSACELIQFSKESILNSLRDNPDSMMQLIEELTNQIRDIRYLGEINSIYSAKDRIMAFLQSEADGNVFCFTYSLTDMAHKINLAQETLYRGLAFLEKEGKIVKQNNRIKLLV